MTFMFNRGHRSWAAATPVKHKRYMQCLMCVLTMMKHSENNRTEEIGLGNWELYQSASGWRLVGYYFKETFCDR